MYIKNKRDSSSVKICASKSLTFNILTVSNNFQNYVTIEKYNRLFDIN